MAITIVTVPAQLNAAKNSITSTVTSNQDAAATYTDHTAGNSVLNLRLAHIDRILLGELPLWNPDPQSDDPELRQRIELMTPSQLRHRIPLPLDVFSVP